jgi:hypothetical protein
VDGRDLRAQINGARVTREAPERSMEKSHFTASDQASGRSYVISGQDSCIEQINDQRVIAGSRVAPGLAQWIALIYPQKDLSHPSLRSTWCAIRLLASSPLATLK